MQRAERFRTLGDPTRLRIVALLSAEELSVGELQNVLGMGQSTVSGHLAQLRAAGLVSARRDGPLTRYQIATPEGEDELVALLVGAPLPEPDQAALDRVLAEREAPAPEGLGGDFMPGRSWEALARLLLALAPPLRIADVGVGTGRLTTLLAANARHLIAIDCDEHALIALPEGVERRLGRLEDLPLARGEVDLIVLSQSLHCVEDPISALRRCHVALEPGGRVAVLDLELHAHEWVRHRLGHRHLGFVDLPGMLTESGFVAVQSRVVHRDRRAPAFATVMAVGTR